MKPRFYQLDEAADSAFDWIDGTVEPLILLVLVVCMFQLARCLDALRALVKLAQPERIKRPHPNAPRIASDSEPTKATRDYTENPGFASPDIPPPRWQGGAWRS